MKFRLPLLLIACSALALNGCSARKSSSMAISGTIISGAPVEFAGGAQLQLLLTDVSAQGAAPEAVNSAVNIRQLPYQYSLPYEPSTINATHRYTISARVYVDKVLKYASDSAVEVLTQGRGNQADFSVIATGNNDTSPIKALAAAEIFQGELHNAEGVTLYRAGIVDGHINWLEEDRSNGTPMPAHNRYEFKGALLIHYKDSVPMEITFDETGKPQSVIRNGKPAVIKQEMTAINAARNRAALLRSVALAQHESQLHRKETKNDVGE